jgi:hypothetical protein
MSDINILQSKQKQVKEEVERKELPLNEQIEVLREYLEHPENREEIAEKWEFKRAYGILCSMPNHLYRRIFYGKEVGDVIEGLIKLVNT